MAEYILLDDIQLPPDLQWTDEHRWSPVAQNVAVTLAGSLVMQTGAQATGRPITLSGEHAWVTRATVERLRAMSNAPNLWMTLILLDGRRFVVAFRHQDGALEADPVLFAAPLEDEDRYRLTLRFIEITNHVDSLQAQLASAIDASQTVLHVQAGQGGHFPALLDGGNYQIQLYTVGQYLNREIMTVTARDGDMLTVSRGADGTTPFAWPTNTVVELRQPPSGMGSLQGHAGLVDNPHQVTASQLGLGQVLDGAQLLRAENLGDLPDKAAAIANLGILQDDITSLASTYSSTRIEGKLATATQGLAPGTHTHNDYVLRTDYDTALAGKLNAGAQAADSAKLGGQPPSAYASQAHDHDAAYAAIGHDHTGFADAVHSHDYAPLTHDHEEYAPLDHAHAELAVADHTHDARYYTETEIDGLLDNKLDIDGQALDSAALEGYGAAYFATAAHDHDTDYAALTHYHDGSYYAKVQVDTLLGGKLDTGAQAADSALLDGQSAADFAPSVHNHDARYYTETEIDGLLGGKLDAGAQAADSALLATQALATAAAANTVAGRDASADVTARTLRTTLANNDILSAAHALAWRASANGALQFAPIDSATTANALQASLTRTSVVGLGKNLEVTRFVLSPNTSFTFNITPSGAYPARLVDVVGYGFFDNALMLYVINNAYAPKIIYNAGLYAVGLTDPATANKINVYISGDDLVFYNRTAGSPGLLVFQRKLL